MKNAELKEVFGRLGPVQVVDRNQSGSKESVVLRPKGDSAEINAIAATQALAQCGLKLLLAKRAVESVIDEGEALLVLPQVASRERLANELAAVGVHPEFIRRSPKLKSKNASKEWVKKVRTSVGLTQKQFSVMFGVDLKTLQKYEQGDSVPAAAVQAYLQTIEANPEKMMRMRIEG
ncbi:hypothetical protein DSM110093_03795 (plasmid) [Sulfitobacter sp. DSM 110093]|uniref:type II toxin-antitoxin system MqsA family antitoxin n=1 Tax=Sulfitobacter sp. DSM 110093 TaxID=2883127 RepID=UPI001FAD6DCE|nr:type II toxin-antitoxin system MqsA family antitoxin [Sulfitobacter sp. DSM 110093]UOA33699.1 hypothetical protein DSM110093_03534 [Sulfitobacter sp. DSM 110093]UOA33960.1 hypothetical protein DSM110093_03795 [Sulfitobacter sp. DSM 110093]